MVRSDHADGSIPRFEASRPEPSITNIYWSLSFRGIAVPVPIALNDWTLRFERLEPITDSLFALSNESDDFGFIFSNAGTSDWLAPVHTATRRFKLPAPSLTHMETLRLAVKLDPTDIICDGNDVQKTVNQVAALYMKPWFFERADVVYGTDGGLLSQGPDGDDTRWIYIAETETDPEPVRIFYLASSSSPAASTALELGSDFASSEDNIPAWLPLYFEAISDLTLEAFLRLKRGMQDYEFDEVTWQSLDAFIEDFED
ncbi:MAG: hypothetical protein AAGH76_16745 [Pseudomonadota bacterium]